MRGGLRSLTYGLLVVVLGLAAVASLAWWQSRRADTGSPKRQAARLPISASFLAALPQEKAEVAVYEVLIEGEKRPLRAASVLSVVSYDPSRHVESSARDPAAVAALKWRFFQRLFEGRKSYQLEASDFFYLHPADLRPLKWSHGGTSWEGGFCCTLLLRQPDGLLRDPRGQYVPLAADLYLTQEIPLLVRALDFEHQDRHVFEVPRLELEAQKRYNIIETRFKGRPCLVEARLAGRQEVRLSVGGDPRQAERIVVRYCQPIRADMPAQVRLLAATRGVQETYWRSVEPSRQLLRLDTHYYARKLSMRWIEGAVIDYRHDGLPESLLRQLEAAS